MDLVANLAQPIAALAILAVIARIPESRPAGSPFFDKHNWTLRDAYVVVLCVIVLMLLYAALCSICPQHTAYPLDIMMLPCVAVPGFYYFAIKRPYRTRFVLFGIDRSKFLKSGVATLNIFVAFSVPIALAILSAAGNLPNARAAGSLSTFSFCVLLALVCLVSPVCEELLFRGLLYAPVARRIGRWNGTIALSLVFCLMHSQDLWGSLLAFCFSILVYYFYTRCESLLVAILMHIGFNLLLWQPLSMVMLAQHVSADSLRMLFIYTPICAISVIDIWWFVAALREPTTQHTHHEAFRKE